MSGYWIRHRLLPSIVLSVILALLTGFLFVSPYISQRASNYNSQSIYKNTDIDFIAPEPSFEQMAELPGTHGIDKIFPFYLTKTQVNVDGKSRTTTVLLSDDFSNIEMTMYNKNRLIEGENTDEGNNILVDWGFCAETSSKIGDEVSFTIAGKEMHFTISAIYETNSIYDGGAILAKINDEQKSMIDDQSNNNGYSGMYVSASDYQTCQSYLTTEYRPLGRLQDRDDFDSDEQYDVHYNAIMSSGYANEITDFRIRKNENDVKGNSLLIWIGAILTMIMLIAFNIAMARRGCEKVYFNKHCVPKGQDINPYYSTSFVFELVACILLYVLVVIARLKLSSDYIPLSAIDFKVALIPAAVLLAEIICKLINNTTVSDIREKIRIEEEKRKAQMVAKVNGYTVSPETKEKTTAGTVRNN